MGGNPNWGPPDHKSRPIHKHVQWTFLLIYTIRVKADLVLLVTLIGSYVPSSDPTFGSLYTLVYLDHFCVSCKGFGSTFFVWVSSSRALLFALLAFKHQRTNGDHICFHSNNHDALRNLLLALFSDIQPLILNHELVTWSLRCQLNVRQFIYTRYLLVTRPSRFNP